MEAIAISVAVSSVFCFATARVVAQVAEKARESGWGIEVGSKVLSSAFWLRLTPPNDVAASTRSEPIQHQWK